MTSKAVRLSLKDGCGSDGCGSDGCGSDGCCRVMGVVVVMTIEVMGVVVV
jgi:hypothetical protein